MRNTDEMQQAEGSVLPCRQTIISTSFSTARIGALPSPPIGADQMKLSYDSALQAYQAAGVTYLRDGGDRWGVCLLAAQLAPEYGIRYAAPGAPLCPTGRYGGFLGRGFAGCDEFRRLVAVNKQSGADFIKLILSGLMDFSSPGALTEPDLPRQIIADCIAIAHDAGLPVMVHCNGATACLAAIQAGADSLEHGAYLDDEALAALAESQTVWVPTLAPYRQSHWRWAVSGRGAAGDPGRAAAASASGVSVWGQDRLRQRRPGPTGSPMARRCAMSGGSFPRR